MKNFVQKGDTITVTAPSGGIVSGVGLQVGSLFGVAAFSADQGDDVEIKTTGVFDLAKENGATFSVGDPVFWDPTAKVVTEEDTSGPDRVGVALAEAGSSATTARVRLDGMVS
jgi:predicted RecA/RadA family phage recombinase